MSWGGGAPTPDLESTRLTTPQPEIYEIDDEEDEVTENKFQEDEAFTSQPTPSPAAHHHFEATKEQPSVYDVDMDEEIGELEAQVIQPTTEDTCKHFQFN